MKFSMIYEAQIAETHREAEHQVFREMAEQCVQLDKSGFDGVWCVEHHGLTQYSHMSAPETFLAFVAGQTKKLEIGHGVVCLPPAMNHPIKVAERVAMLDILSGGRVNFGVGKGGSQQEAGAFGYQLSELQPLIDESMYLIPRLFTEEVVEHDGQYIKFPARPVHPKPMQDPHPRMYMACTRWEAVVTAGSRGLGALVMAFGGPDEIKTKSDAYRKAFAERKPEDQVGYRPTEHLSALCPAIVMRDRDKARRIGLRGQRFFAEALSHWYQGGPRPKVDDMSPEEHLAALDKVREHKFAKLGEDKIAYNPQAYGYLDDINDAYGTPEDCIRYVERLFEAGADEIMFMSQMGTVPHEAIMETIELIGSEVIPHFRGKKLRVAAAE